MTTYRSRKSAVAAAEAAGFTTDQVTITKLTTAKYELVLTEVGTPTEFDADAWIAQELAKATSAADAERYLAMGEEFTKDYHHELARQIRAKFAPAKATKAPRAARINRHWNDDGSLTLYHMGVKLRRLGGEDNEEASEEELEDPEAFAEKYLGRRFPKKAGGWVWGRTTQGHNWHTKRAKALREQIAALAEAGKDTAELEARLATVVAKTK